MYLTAEDASMPGQMLAGFLIGGLLMFGVGFAWAVMRRANLDYKNTKAAVPKLRKGFWLAWWAAMKAAFWVLLVLACFVTWLVYRGEDPPPAGPTQPAKVPTVSRSAK